MPIVINTNLAGLRAGLQLDRSESVGARSVARLASGLRVRSAADDAAGLAISGRMAAQIRGLTVASRNAQDGISLTQTADGSLGSIGANLQRLRELAVQSLNGTNSSADRGALQIEALQLLAEVDRIAAQTSFNGRALLDGSFAAQAFQVGANNGSGQRIMLSGLASTRTDVLGLTTGAPTPPPVTTTAVTGSALSAASVIDGLGQLVINGVDLYRGLTIRADASLIAASIGAAGIAGLTATAAPTVLVGNWADTGPATVDFVFNGVFVNGAVHSGSRNSDVADTVSLVNDTLGPVFLPGLTAFDNGSGATLRLASGANITFSSAGAVGIGLGGIAGDGSATPVTSYSTYSLSYTGTTGLSIGGSRAAALGLTPMTAPPPPTSGGTTSLAQLDLSTITGANAALASLDAAIGSVDNARATLGAHENRFRSVLGNIGTEVETTIASRSRIVDADYAVEATDLARSQILQSAGLAMVAQASASPAWVLVLLRQR